MKFALISDTHGWLPPVELFVGADLVLHAGDIGPDYNVLDWIGLKWSPWVEALNDMCIPVHATYGNHDFPTKWGGYVNEEIHLNELVSVGDQHIWFSPWSPRFGNWAWMLSEPELTEQYVRIPDHTTMIVSHSPMWRVGDSNIDGMLCGSKALRVRVGKLPSVHTIVCGHIHEAHGVYTPNISNTVRSVLNVASVDERYQPRAQPITWLEIDKE